MVFCLREDVEGILEHEVLAEVLDARKNARGQISYHDRSDPHTKGAFGRVLDRRTFRDGDEDELEREQDAVEGDDSYGNIRSGRSPCSRTSCRAWR